MAETLIGPMIDHGFPLLSLPRIQAETIIPPPVPSRGPLGHGGPRSALFGHARPGRNFPSLGLAGGRSRTVPTLPACLIIFLALALALSSSSYPVSERGRWL
jgi:hypothetical protein